jgi:hypothetical protein
VSSDFIIGSVGMTFFFSIIFVKEAHSVSFENFYRGVLRKPNNINGKNTNQQIQPVKR